MQNSLVVSFVGLFAVLLFEHVVLNMANSYKMFLSLSVARAFDYFVPFLVQGLSSHSVGR